MYHNNSLQKNIQTQVSDTIVLQNESFQSREQHNYLLALVLSAVYACVYIHNLIGEKLLLL